MRKYVIIGMLVFGICGFTVAQESKTEHSNFKVGLEGMLGMSFADNFFSVNIGGPTLMLRVAQEIKVGVGAFPSVYVKESKSGARLGVGPRVDVKNFVLFSSFFHFDRADFWQGSIGIGYKFHGKK